MKGAVYDREFKMSAEKWHRKQGNSVLAVSKSLEIGGSSLHRWINEYDEYREKVIACNYAGNHFFSIFLSFQMPLSAASPR
ncbi:hypothetical protein V6615_01500 [Oscillospiraceae bacterium PP1C4]